MCSIVIAAKTWTRKTLVMLCVTVLFVLLRPVVSIAEDEFDEFASGAASGVPGSNVPRVVIPPRPVPRSVPAAPDDTDPASELPPAPPGLEASSPLPRAATPTVAPTPISAPPVAAAVTAPSSPVPASANRAPDVRVLIDVSGSMKTTDPANLRAPALKLLTSLAKPGSSMGVWSFGSDVISTVNYGRVDDTWKAAANLKAGSIRSDSALTHIGLALEHAANRLWTPDPAVERTIILLSDGKVDVSTDPVANEQEQRRIFTYVVPRLRQGGYRVHSIALSRNADTAFLKRLADETGGPYSLAESADDLMKIFVKASDQVNKPLQVPLVGGDFRIDPLVKEFTALIYRKEGSKPAVLISPSRKRIEAATAPSTVKWFSDPRFDLVTVTKPENGQWKIEGDLDPDNRVTVVSNLDVMVSGLPEQVLAGEKMIMEMSLTDRGKPLINPRFLSLMEIGFSQDSGEERFTGQLSRDRQGAAVVPADGIYRARLGRTLTPGDHVFRVSVDGKTFTRTVERHMTVHREALSVAVENEFREGRAGKYVVMRPVVAVVDTADLKITAKLADPAGNKTSRQVEPNESGQWRLDVPPDEKGLYRVFLSVQGKTREGNAFSVEQGPIEVDYTPRESRPLIEKAETVELLESDLVTAGEDAMPAEDGDTTDSQSPEQEPEPAPEPAEPPEPAGPSWVDNIMPGTPGFHWLMFIFGNCLLIGGGVFFYLNYMQDADEEQNRLVEELVKIKDRNRVSRQAAPDLGYAASTSALPPLGIPAMASGMDAYTAATASMAVPPPAIAPIEPRRVSDATVLMPSGMTVSIPAAEKPTGPDRTYTIDAAPLELDDDSLVELDDNDDGADELGALLAAHAAGQSGDDSGHEDPQGPLDEREDTRPSVSDDGEDWVTLPEDDPLDTPVDAHAAPDEPTVSVSEPSPLPVLEGAEPPEMPATEELTVRMASTEPEAGAMMMPMDDLESILAEQEALEAQFAAIESSLEGGGFAEDEFKLDHPGA